MLFHSIQGAGGATPPRGEAIFTTTGDTSWVVPSGVSSISAVCIGGGGGGLASSSGGNGGGGGDLRYYNNLTVNPGETLTITVGAIGTKGDADDAIDSTAGGYSRIARSGTVLLEAAGGGKGTTGIAGAKNGTSSTIAGSIGGGDGGDTTNGASNTSGGGGGAGGYSGNGGNGAAGLNSLGSAAAANSGGGGGGGGGGDTATAYEGGGVNVFGIGPTAGASESQAPGYPGSYSEPFEFGSGGGGADQTANSADDGSQGAVRILWPGSSRSFPSTDVGMSEVITTFIEAQSATSGSITIPASALAGDLAVLLNMHQTSGTQTDPSGWTRIINQESLSPIMTVWYRIIQSGDAGTSVTMTGGTAPSSQMILFRKASGTISSVTVSGGTIERSTGLVTTQVQSASTKTGPFIVFNAFANSQVISSVGKLTYCTGGIAGSGNVEPFIHFHTKGSTDGSRQGFMRFRIYDSAPATNVSVVHGVDVANNTMGSFIIEVN